MPPTRGKPSKRAFPAGFMTKSGVGGGANSFSIPPSTLASGANSEEGTPQPNQTLADRLTYFTTPMPFKNPAFVSGGGGGAVGKNRNKKSVRQILAMERERAGGGGIGSGGGGMGSRSESRKTTPVPVVLRDGGKKGEEMDVTEVMEGPVEERKRKLDDIITYLTPTAPPSLFPPKKYCDITGLPARYTDPKTRLHYRGLEVWSIIRSLGPGYDQAYLTLRRANNALV